jgi:signal transduction histidine kinase
MALALVAVLTAGAVALYFVPAWLPRAGWFVTVVVVATLLPWCAGRFWRHYQQLVRAGWERAEQLQREQRLVAEHARLRERTRIAQDMHDVLGHDLSLIALSAGALKLAPGLEEHHRRAAGDLRARAATAVERLGEVIGVLREETDGAPTAPGGPRLTDLLSEASAAGLAVESHLDRTPQELPLPVARAAHRVVQEALTNVARHAPGATATVRVTHTPAETNVVVENGPPPARAPRPDPDLRLRGGGRGLLGLEERMRLVGGTFDHGPRDGGYAVAARIPHTPRAPLAPVVSPGAGLPQEHRRARRRAGRALAAVVMVPLMAGALLSAVLTGWEMLSTSRSVLDPGDRARLRVGQDRSEAERFLPDRQTHHRPSTAGPTEEGTECEYYATTADRFDDRSGDVHRLCFRADTLVSLDTLTR